jgi:hypothetical protein
LESLVLKVFLEQLVLLETQVQSVPLVPQVHKDFKVRQVRQVQLDLLVQLVPQD